MKNLQRFLEESNAIEGVYDADSYKQALLAWQYCINQPTMTLGVVLKTHKILMLHQPLMPNEKGYLREIPVYIGGHEAMPTHLLRTALSGWAEKMNIVEFNDFWQDLHVEYEAIHPFVDGNGRTGRIFMNWHRVKQGLPILVINESEKQDYYAWFN